MGTTAGNEAGGQLAWEVSDGDHAVEFRPTSGDRGGTCVPEVVLSDDSCGLIRLDFCFRFFPLFFQDESIPEILFLSPRTTKIMQK